GARPRLGSGRGGAGPAVRAVCQHEAARQRAGTLAGARHRVAAWRRGDARRSRGRGRVRAPRAAARRGGRAVGRGRMTPRTRLDVLVVDDDADIRQMLRGVLEDEGHAVAEAGDGQRALARLGEKRFDAVLLDVKMPGMGGLEALEAIREQAPHTGIIMVSGEGSIATAVTA